MLEGVGKQLWGEKQVIMIAVVVPVLGDVVVVLICRLYLLQEGIPLIHRPQVSLAQTLHLPHPEL